MNAWMFRGLSSPGVEPHSKKARARKCLQLPPFFSRELRLQLLLRLLLLLSLPLPLLLLLVFLFQRLNLLRSPLLVWPSCVSALSSSISASTSFMNVD
jgi:hypothetical protein